jgi:Porin subfamily
MKILKHLFVSTPALFLAAPEAVGADLSIKAKAIEHVKICSLYGAGFFYIPGTDTCMKIGGFARADTTFNGGVYDIPAWSGSLGAGDRFADFINSRTRVAMTVDTRTPTEYGVVRTFAQADFQFNNFGTQNGASPSFGPGGGIGASAGTPITAGQLSGLNSGLLNGPGGGYVPASLVFMQVAGFTFGKSASAYATPWHGYPGNNTSYLIGGHDTITGVNNIQYTAQFGNGVSGTVGLDDPTVMNRTALYNLSTGVAANGLATTAYGGFVAPDFVGNVRVEQAWGLLQLSGALHTLNGSYNSLAAFNTPTATSILSGHPDSKIGGSVMAAIQIKNIPTGPGDDLKLDATWAKGDTKNVISTSALSPSFAMIGGVPGQFGPGNTYGFGATTDGVWLPTAFGGDGSIHLTEAYGIRGAFNHNWNPSWSSSVFGGAGWVRYDETARTEYCLVYALAAPGQGRTYSCNPNYAISMLGGVIRWTPVKGLAISAEMIWTHLNTAFSGSSIFTPGAPQPIQVWTYHNQDTLSLNVRIGRVF